LQTVLDTIEQWSERIEAHPLHRWLSEEHENIPDEKKLWFSMYFCNFIMYFRELNRYHINYGDERKNDPLREALSSHADEDMTHSRLFMKDFKTLGMDGVLGWTPSQTLYWLANSQVNEQLRRRTSELTKLVVSSREPEILFPVVESIESCGHSLFSHATVLADRFTRKTGKPLVYWGHFHLKRETGHAVDSGEDQLFESLKLTPAQRETAIRKVIRVFELIEEQNSDMLRLAQETISQGGFATRTRLHTAPVAFKINESEAKEEYDFHFWPEKPHQSQEPVVQALKSILNTTRDYSTSELFQGHSVEDVVRKLRIMALFLSFDITGGPTAYRYLMPIANPTTPVERALERLTRRFGRRAEMLYVDWQSLMLDEALEWPVSRMLEFLYLDPATEVCRKLRNTVVHHVDYSPSALRVYWVMVTIKSITSAYLGPMIQLARRAEEELGIELPYFMQRQNPATVVLEPDPEADAVQFETFHVDVQTRHELVSAITCIGSGMIKNLQAMEEMLETRKYSEIYNLLPSRGG
jgi:hypothetical protein